MCVCFLREKNVFIAQTEEEKREEFFNIKIAVETLGWGLTETR